MRCNVATLGGQHDRVLCRMCSLWVVYLKSGYDSRILSPISHDLTSFYVEGMGMLRLTRLLQGHTNSVAEFQRCMQHMIRAMYPGKAEVFIDDCAVKGPKTKYRDETIMGNDH